MLRNMPVVPVKKRGKRCTALLTGGMTAVEKAELNVQRAQERLQVVKLKAAEPKKTRVTMTQEEADLFEQFKAARNVNQLGVAMQNVQLGNGHNMEVSAASQI